MLLIEALREGLVLLEQSGFGAQIPLLLPLLDDVCGKLTRSRHVNRCDGAILRDVDFNLELDEELICLRLLRISFQKLAHLLLGRSNIRVVTDFLCHPLYILFLVLLIELLED